MADKNMTKSTDPKQKDKKAPVGKEQKPEDSAKTMFNEGQSQGGGLTEKDLPDSTNESTGKMGSGQRQDSN